MDIMQDYASTALHLYNTADPYFRPIRSAIYGLQARAYPIILPYLNSAAIAAQDSPGILSVGVFLLFLLVAVQILNFLRRIVMWWLRLIWWASVTAVLVLVVSAVWQRGPERVLEDVADWVAHLTGVWKHEYKRWEGYQNQAQAQARSQRVYQGHKGTWT